MCKRGDNLKDFGVHNNPRHTSCFRYCLRPFTCPAQNSAFSASEHRRRSSSLLAQPAQRHVTTVDLVSLYQLLLPPGGLGRGQRWFRQHTNERCQPDPEIGGRADATRLSPQPRHPHSGIPLSTYLSGSWLCWHSMLVCARGTEISPRGTALPALPTLHSHEPRKRGDPTNILRRYVHLCDLVGPRETETERFGLVFYPY